MSKPRGKLVYCNWADVISQTGNVIKSQRYYSGKVVDGKLETVSPHDLRSGDLIHFRPLIPVVGMTPYVGTLAVVHGTTPSGLVVLGNIHIAFEQLKEINRLHVSGKF